MKARYIYREVKKRVLVVNESPVHLPKREKEGTHGK
jgi:hypothetical protein